jgi:hypothetical protein
MTLYNDSAWITGGDIRGHQLVVSWWISETYLTDGEIIEQPKPAVTFMCNIISMLVHQCSVVLRHSSHQHSLVSPQPGNNW